MSQVDSFLWKLSINLLLGPWDIQKLYDHSLCLNFFHLLDYQIIIFFRIQTNKPETIHINMGENKEKYGYRNFPHCPSHFNVVV
jgi:hypothetical protein